MSWSPNSTDGTAGTPPARPINLGVIVAVVEDDPRYRRSLETLFSHATGFALGGSYGSAADALAYIDRRLADGKGIPWTLVLMDLALPGMTGIEATAEFKRRLPNLPIVILTVFEQPALILEAICAGANGYLLKKAPAGELIAQLKSIADGGAPLTAGVARTVLSLLQTSNPGRTVPRSAVSAMLELTMREQQVLQCLVRGCAYKQVADELDISIDTVRSHIRAIYKKLQVHSVAEAVSRALREKLV